VLEAFDLEQASHSLRLTLAEITGLCYFLRPRGIMTKSPPKTILVVEDEADAAEMFAEMMRVSGYRVLKATNSTLAMELIAKEKPSAVILDIMMPDISGLDILNFMRKEPELSQIPVVVVSAKSMPADIKTGLEAGAAAYLTKPVGFLDLKEAVEKVILS